MKIPTFPLAAVLAVSLAAIGYALPADPSSRERTGDSFIHTAVRAMVVGILGSVQFLVQGILNTVGFFLGLPGLIFGFKVTMPTISLLPSETTAPAAAAS